MNESEMLSNLNNIGIIVNAVLESLINVCTAKAICGESPELYQGEIINAVRYSLMSGGKRLRPALVISFCQMCGGDMESAVAPAAAIEMVHTFSLIHDDMPCMDDDDMRRGKPSCHKAYGEAMALLAGDALLNHAFKVIAEDESGSLSDKTKTKLIAELAGASGIMGMIGGQVIDMDNTSANNFPAEKILKMYSLKTSALIKCACRMGCISAGAEDKLPYADEFGENFGLAFQIKDDILDVTSSPEILGKNTGSDEKQDKETYLKRVGMERAEKALGEYTEKALSALDNFPDSPDLNFLKALTVWQRSREK